MSELASFTLHDIFHLALLSAQSTTYDYLWVDWGAIVRLLANLGRMTVIFPRQLDSSKAYGWSDKKNRV